MMALFAPALRLDRTKPRICSAAQLVSFSAMLNETSTVLAVAVRPHLLGLSVPESSRMSRQSAITLLSCSNGNKCDKHLGSGKAVCWFTSDLKALVLALCYIE